MCSEWNSVSLDSLGVLRARGADVVSFLQGQLSNDVALLGPERSLRRWRAGSRNSCCARR
jgi:folate-binding Fe-S cluster repair protein YgfZ